MSLIGAPAAHDLGLPAGGFEAMASIPGFRRILNRPILEPIPDLRMEGFGRVNSASVEPLPSFEAVGTAPRRASVLVLLSPRQPVCRAAWDQRGRWIPDCLFHVSVQPICRGYLRAGHVLSAGILDRATDRLTLGRATRRNSVRSSLRAILRTRTFSRFSAERLRKGKRASRK